MKKPGFINRLLTVVLMLIACHGLFATNIQVSDIVIVERDDAEQYIIVQFDLSWDYSFRVDDGDNTNWDAAWVFMKYKDVNGADNVQWGHATLSGSGHTIPGNFTSSLGATDGDNKGIFIYPSVIFANTAEVNGIQLRWDYGEDGLLPEDEVDIRVFGIEMVYVPTGSFYVGSGGGEASRFHAGGESNTTPFQVGSAPFEIGNSAGNLWATGNRSTGAFAGGYPTGYNAFYMMKHNITQQAYVDFLNTLTYEQQDERIDGTPGDAVGTYTNDENNRHTIKIAYQGSSGSEPAVYETDNPYLPVNFFSPDDLLSYLDWTALRPYTELEYEKAARGPASPVPDEFAWGNTRAGQITSISDAGTANEAPVASGYQRDITIDHTKVNQELTDFPILVRFDEDNFDFDNCREDGFDFRFYDSNGDLLSYQRQRHDFTNKKAEYWVMIPTISNTQNTVITLEYGNLSAADGADPANVWDASFVSLWHLDEEAVGTADEYKDSKGDNDGTGIGTVAANIEGKIGLAQEFAGAGSISIANDATLDIDEYVTISGWVKPQELTGITRTEASSADWDDFHSRDNLTAAADKLAVDTGPGTGWRISNAIALDDIKKVGSSSISWQAEFGYKVVEFTSSGTFSVPEGVTEVDVLVVAGGGGGGGTIGGGGGAGGLVYQSGYAVTAGSNISVTVGNGGLGGVGYDNAGQAGLNGGDSQFGSILTTGGGGGAGWNGHPPTDGGSGGGGAGTTNDPTYAEGTAGQGNDGGTSTIDFGGGGGGAGQVGENGASGAGKGGDGLYYGTIFGDEFGDNGWFAGGGGGGVRQSEGGNVRHDGGQGGGGQGHYTHTEKAGNGVPGTGGGGGGAGYAGTSTDRIGGDGGSGVVLVRYKDPESVRVYTAINNNAVTPPVFDNIEVFNSNGTFTVPEGVTEVDVLIVAGGGGGGGSAGPGASGAGGGAGGVVYARNVQVTDPSYAIVVGAGGGSTGSGSDTQGTDGGNSSAFGLTAIGGGGGGSRAVGTADGRDGGSGGGVGSQQNGTIGDGLQPGSASGGFGSNGGDSGFGSNTSDDNASGGGGGAGGTGSTGQDNVRSGNGGIGRYYGNIFSDSYGDDGWFASGGGGGNPAGARTTGLGGKGGGADGGSNDAANAMANTGGGGGGAGANGAPSNGGSGIVIVRWGHASNGGAIPNINDGDDLTGKYLWVKQELITNNAAHTPELDSLGLEIKGEAIIFGKGEDAYQLTYYDGQLRGYINNQRVSSTITTDEYQHVAITYSGSNQRLFVNGLLTSTLGLTGNINTNANDIYLGTNLQGDLDEFRLSSSARSQAWLQSEYHSGEGDLVQIGGEAQVNNAVFGNINWGAGIGQGPLRVGFGASPTSSRTASGASYWGIMELSGNLWERVVPAGSAAGRAFTGLHGDGGLDASGLFNTTNWTNELGNRGGSYHHDNTSLFRVSDRNSMGWTAGWADRERWQGGRGVRTAP